jgi:hypothetical protein
MDTRLRRAGLLISGTLAAAAGIVTFAQASEPPIPATDGGSTVVTQADVPLHARSPSISGDGRWVVYEGRPIDGSERASTVFLADLSDPSAAPVELSSPAPDARLGDSVRPVISGDGCTVAIATQIAYDLFRDDDGDRRWDVYQLRLPHCGGTPGDWALVSTQSSADGDTSALDRVDPTDAPSSSADGTVVAFTHLLHANRDDLFAVSVVDLAVPVGEPGRTTVAAGMPAMPPDERLFRYVGQRHPDVSDDGSVVVFESDALADAIRPEWGTGPVEGGFALTQVYAWNRAGSLADESVLLVSGRDGVPSAEGASSPVVSGSGQFVAYLTSSADLLGDAILPPCRGACPQQVVRTDLADGTTELVSRANTSGGPGVAADLGGSQPAITTDGSQIAFVTRSTNLFVTPAPAGIELDDGDVVVSTVDLGDVRRIATLSDGVSPTAAVHAHPAVSANGHVVVFDTLATDVAARPVVAAHDGGRRLVASVRPPVLSAPQLDVGTVAVALPGPEWYIPIRNEGPSTFVPSVITSSNPDFAITDGGTCRFALPVLPGQWCTVELVLTPSVAGPIEGELTVGDGLPAGASVTTLLRGQGGDPTLVPPLLSLDFGLTDVGQRAPSISFDIGNVGFAPATITSIDLTGSHPDDFVIESDSCIGFSVNPGSTCSIAVAFAPTQAGHRTASVRVVTSLGQYTTVLANGDATRSTTIVAANDEVRPGDSIGLGGSGFAPFSTVVVSWTDGRGDPITVRTGSEGTFLVEFPTSRNERPGDRQIVAQSGESVTSVDIRVMRRPDDATRPPG